MWYLRDVAWGEVDAQGGGGGGGPCLPQGSDGAGRVREWLPRLLAAMGEGGSLPLVAHADSNGGKNKHRKLSRFF